VLTANYEDIIKKEHNMLVLATEAETAKRVALEREM
jgi:hypothetical protein